MTLQFIDRPVDQIQPLPYVRPSTPRPIKGIVLHHTASASDPVSVRSDASWHWLVGRSTLYRDIAEEDIAFHDAYTDKWRPAWVVESPYGVSAINFSSIGIEITCAPQNMPPQGYTDYQYDTLMALLRDIYARYGPLPAVGHGEVDSTKWPTEPHGLDWERIGFGPRIGNAGRFLTTATPEPEVPVVDPNKPPPPWNGPWDVLTGQIEALRQEVAARNQDVAEAEKQYADLNNAYAAVLASNRFNYDLKMVMENLLRYLESRRRLKRGTTDNLIASVPPQ